MILWLLILGGLVIKFILDAMEKPKQTFRPTQYISWYCISRVLYQFVLLTDTQIDVYHQNWTEIHFFFISPSLFHSVKWHLHFLVL